MGTRPEALITTPTNATYCTRCEQIGVRYGNEWTDVDGVIHGDGTEYAHCPECGTTHLDDMRSIFEVLHEARALAMDPFVDPGVRMERLDVAERLAHDAANADRNHCSDCAAWARKVEMEGSDS